MFLDLRGRLAALESVALTTETEANFRLHDLAQLCSCA